jgi:hypothetical protein
MYRAILSCPRMIALIRHAKSIERAIDARWVAEGVSQSDNDFVIPFDSARIIIYR